MEPVQIGDLPRLRFVALSSSISWLEAGDRAERGMRFVRSTILKVEYIPGSVVRPTSQKGKFESVYVVERGLGIFTGGISHGLRGKHLLD